MIKQRTFTVIYRRLVTYEMYKKIINYKCLNLILVIVLINLTFKNISFSLK